MVLKLIQHLYMVFQDAPFRVVFVVSFCSICGGSAGALAGVWKCPQHPPAMPCRHLHPQPDPAHWSCVRNAWLALFTLCSTASQTTAATRSLVILWKQDEFILSHLSELIYARNSKFPPVLVPLLWIFEDVYGTLAFKWLH